MKTKPQRPDVFRPFWPLPGLDLAYIAGGTFTMGDNNGADDDEKPEHQVEVSSFYLNRYPVTQELYEVVTGENPAQFKDPERPVETVSWHDAQNFIKKLNEQDAIKAYLNEHLPGYVFRLPTEAEWEYAARGGQDGKNDRHRYAGSDDLTQVGWYDKNSDGETHPVGLLLPNELGLYDMSGNVYEWCEDWFDEELYKKRVNQIVKDPKVSKQGDPRVIRGGYCFTDANSCRPACRDYFDPGDRLNRIGFRVALALQSLDDLSETPVS